MAPDAMLLAVDQGTSATKALLVDAAGTIVARGARSATAVGIDGRDLYTRAHVAQTGYRTTVGGIWGNE